MNDISKTLSLVAEHKKTHLFSCAVFIAVAFFLFFGTPPNISQADFHGNQDNTGSTCSSIKEHPTGHICQNEIGTCCNGATNDKQTKWMSCSSSGVLGIFEQACLADSPYEINAGPKACGGHCGPGNFTPIMDCQEVANAFLAVCEEETGCDCSLVEWDCQAALGCFSLVPVGSGGVCSSLISYQCPGDDDSEEKDVECIEEDGEIKCDPYFACSGLDQCSLVEGSGFGVSDCSQCSGDGPDEPFEECEVNPCFSQECSGYYTNDCPAISSCEITAEPSGLAGGGNVEISWETDPLANVCNAGGGWSGEKDGSGQETVFVDQTTNLTLDCSNGAYCEQQVTVNNPPSPPEPPMGSCVLDGWAWGGYDNSVNSVGGGGVGWVSFSSNNTDGGADYGMWFDLEGELGPEGALYGYAWADPGDGNSNDSGSYGWLQFGSLSAFPDSPGNNAYIDFDNPVGGEGSVYPVKGWARFLTGINDSDGWDGWVKLSGTAENGQPYGLEFEYDEGAGEGFFSGYAWGGPHMGWVSFSGGEYGVEAMCEVFDFELTVVPDSIYLQPGEGQSFDVEVSNLSQDVSEIVNITFENTPDGVTILPSEDSCDPDPDNSCTTTYTAQADVESEEVINHEVIVNGNSQSSNASDSTSLTITIDDDDNGGGGSVDSVECSIENANGEEVNGEKDDPDAVLEVNTQATWIVEISGEGSESYPYEWGLGDDNEGSNPAVVGQGGSVVINGSDEISNVLHSTIGYKQAEVEVGGVSTTCGVNVVVDPDIQEF